MCAVAAALAAAAAVDAATLPASAPFAFTHTGAVSSGPVSLLATYSATQVSTAPPIAFPMFDASVGKLTGVSLVMAATRSTFSVSPSGVLSLVSYATATRSLAYTITAGATTASDGNSVLTSGAALVTLLGLGVAEIGGAPLARTTSFSANADLVNFVGNGNVAVAITATDALTVSTVLSVANGAGFQGSGQYAGTASLTYTYSGYPGGSQVSLSKTASRASAGPGNTITYTIVFTNNGITPVSTFGVEDMTPVYTSYASSQAVALPAGLGAPMVTTPGVAAKGPLAWSFTGPLAPAATGTLQYSVVVDG